MNRLSSSVTAMKSHYEVVVIGSGYGGAIAASQAAQQNAAYCAQRFRSYDPQSGTYLGRDGRRHACP